MVKMLFNLILEIHRHDTNDDKTVRRECKTYDCEFLACGLAVRLGPSHLAWVSLHLEVLVAL
jgi:hypothetical protein